MNIDDYNGDCTISHDHSGNHFVEDRPLPLRIDRADPHIRVAPELLTEVQAGSHPDATYTNGVFRIVGVNRTVEYRIGEQVVDGHGHRWYLADRLDAAT